MNSTPLWVVLLGLLTTLGGTLGGVIITQRRSDRREARAWERERERERDRWAREDELRNFEARREAYISFYEALRETARIAYDYGMGLSPDPPADEDRPHELGLVRFEWHTPMARAHERLRVYASPEVLKTAERAYNACWHWGHPTRWGRDDEAFYDRQDAHNDAELLFYDAMRRDLGLTGVLRDGQPVPGSGWSTVKPEADGGEP